MSTNIYNDQNKNILSDVIMVQMTSGDRANTPHYLSTVWFPAIAESLRHSFILPFSVMISKLKYVNCQHAMELLLMLDLVDIA